MMVKFCGFDDVSCTYYSVRSRSTHVCIYDEFLNLAEVRMVRRPSAGVAEQGGWW